MMLWFVRPEAHTWIQSFTALLGVLGMRGLPTSMPFVKLPHLPPD
jgi:hypothetical protein